MTQELTVALAAAQRQLEELDPSEIAGTPGIYLEIYTRPEYFKPDAFELKQRGIYIASVTPVDDVLRVVVFVPHTALQYFRQALHDYRTKNTPKDKPSQADRFERIDAFRLGTLRSLWTDPPTAFPETEARTWWEVWLFAKHEQHFVEAAPRFEVLVREGSLVYADLIVRLVEATPEQLDDLIRHTDAVSELRSVPKTPSIVTRLPIEAQHQLIEDALERIEPPDPNAPALCLLDSGVNEGHPLLNQHVTVTATWNPSWGTQDDDNHGTPMASIALFGDLLPTLTNDDVITISNPLESVKIYTSAAQDEPELRGIIVRDSVSIVEAEEPRRGRVFYSAVASTDEGNLGIPTEWSAEIDQLASDTRRARLFVIAAGNIDNTGRASVATYPQNNYVRAIYDPGQSWNALTIGGYTERSETLDPPFDDYEPLAPQGALSPVSRTALLWTRRPLAPAKPDVVFEAGNFAYYPTDDEAAIADDYMMVAANADFRTQPLRTFGFTSGATALGAGFCGRIIADQTQLWPETVRGLVVHSAEWTPFMRAELNTIQSKRDRAMFLRRYGYGVPNIDRALRSATNDATMLIQGSVRPFHRVKGEIKTNEMASYSLPWPTEYLLQLGNVPIEMRVTLSYFIEPNPGRRGWKGRYSYPSHGLRFFVRRPTESDDQFDLRVNAADREDDYVDPGLDDEWELGSEARNRGSIHSDIWRGTAAQLANAGRIAIVPVSGWWRWLKERGRWNNDARYALIVSLRSPDATVDLYSEIETIIQTRIEVATRVEVATEV